MHAILTHPVIVGLVVLCAILSFWRLHCQRVQLRDLDVTRIGKPKRNYVADQWRWRKR